MTQLTGSVAITGGRVVPVDGAVIDNGTVLVTDGVITAVGADVTVPDGVPVVDAAGRWVLPGFIDAHAHVGIHEESQGWAGDDTNEMTDPNGARMRALDAINPADEGFRDALCPAASPRWSSSPAAATRSAGRPSRSRRGAASSTRWCSSRRAA